MQLQEISKGILHLFYPRLCEGCSRPLVANEEVLCVGCVMEIPETEYHAIADNETVLRFAGRIPFVHATTYAYFTNDGLLQHLLHGLKYKGKKETGYFLGRQFARSMIKNTTDCKLSGWIGELDMIVPVPLHRSKQQKRGFNQSMLIASGLSEVLGIPVADGLLVRTKDTESQVRKSRSERLSNMADAFGVTDMQPLRGKHILLLDDVLTTGATIEACALALPREAEIRISIATIGIAIS